MSAEDWWAQVALYEADGHPDYSTFVRWQRGRCFPDTDAAQAAYEAAK
jgi:hypothetical protein